MSEDISDQYLWPTSDILFLAAVFLTVCEREIGGLVKKRRCKI